MSDTNQITVRGRVGTDPDIHVTNSGRTITRFRLASTRSYRDQATGEWRETETEWFTVKTWGPRGTQVVQSVRRGMPVIVQGVLSSEEWESGDRQHHTNVITPGTIAVDIRYGLVTHAKVTRQAPADEQATDGEHRTEEEQLAADLDADDAEPDPTADLPEPAEDAWMRSPIEA